MTHDKIMELLVEDITNTTDGAGSDLSFVGDGLEGETWVFIEGYLDISALANTIQSAFEHNDNNN